MIRFLRKLDDGAEEATDFPDVESAAAFMRKDYEEYLARGGGDESCRLEGRWQFSDPLDAAKLFGMKGGRA